jgi:arabinosaccharide transport system substrate-binding protein
MPLLVMISLSVASGLIIEFRGAPLKSDLSLWLYSEAHARGYREILPGFTAQTGRTVGLGLIPQQSLNTRMVSLFMTGRTEGELPDLVELEIADIGKYFRPPVNDVGLLPLNSYLSNSGFLEIPGTSAPGHEGANARSRSDGKIYTYRAGRWTVNTERSRPDAWIDRIVGSRLAPFSKQGIIFGVPHDVHPVTLSYRKDLWDEAGVDPEWAVAPDGVKRRPTWPEFQEKCLKFQMFWKTHGVRNRHAMELFQSQPDMLVCLLLQRHINVIDENGDLHLTDARTVQTVAFYAQLVAGLRQVAVEAAGGTGPWANDIIQGNICSFLTPDWRLTDLRRYAPDLAGKLRMMPLPRFESTDRAGRRCPEMDDAATSTWGGTMIGIARSSKHPDDAWKLIEFLDFSDVGLESRARNTNNLPPLRDYWDKPFFHQPDPFFGGQKTFEMYVDLADQIPPRFETWSSALGRYGLGYTLNQCTGYLRRGGSVEGLEEYAASQLARVERYVRRCIEHGTFQ